MSYVPRAEHYAACGQIRVENTNWSECLGACILIPRDTGLWAVTASHVVKNIRRSDLVVMHSSSEAILTRRVIERSEIQTKPEHDLVAFLLEGPDRDVPVPLFSSDKVVFGQEVYLLGYPNLPLPNSEDYIRDVWYGPVLKSGPTSGIFKSGPDDDTFWLVGAQCNRGFSGGPVCAFTTGDNKSRVIGMTLAMTSDEKERRMPGDYALQPVSEDAGFTWALDIGHIIDLFAAYDN
ncbi:S1 family peptidase [Candidatus Poriferisocius sp.]|uniref:S1 family peptidase n=1 Tax=Candidatus Poriferisocius sp. TaxID=3101276 RepID=UPI003B5C218D